MLKNWAVTLTGFSSQFYRVFLFPDKDYLDSTVHLRVLESTGSFGVRWYQAFVEAELARVYLG